MNVLHALHQLLGNNTPQAKQYAQNPQAEQFKNVDPAQFGYPADNSGSQIQVQPNAYRANLGVPYGPMGQGSQYNPGLTPMQGSQGYGTSPQMRAFNSPQFQQQEQYRIQPGQEWLQ